MKVICLDIDDCIYPGNRIAKDIHSNFWNLKQLEINLWKLSELIRTTESKVFFTSSWSIEWEMAPNNSIKLNNRSNAWDIPELNQVTGYIQQYLGGHIIGISKGDRVQETIDLLKNGNQLVIFDDWNFEENLKEFKNFKFFNVFGNLTNKDIWKAQKFFHGIEN